MKKEEWVLPLVSLLILIISVGILLIIYLPGSVEPVKSPCPRGYCATNIYSGEKICPIGSENVEYSPGVEVCNPRNGCTSSSTPCTYENPSLGSICPGDPDYTGECLGDCLCLAQSYCPDFAEVFFERIFISNSGAPETDSNVFVQNTIWISPTNAPRTDLPLSLGRFDSRVNRTCGLSTSNLSLMWPPGECIRGQLGQNEEDGLWYCFATDLECSETLIRKIDGTFACK